jgi:hypothetical protein
VSRSLGLGHSYFRSKFVLSNIKGVYDYLLEFDRHPSLVPPMTWQHSIPPSPPSRLEVSRTSTGDNLSWSGAQDRSNGPYLLYNIYASTEETVDINNPANLIAAHRPWPYISIRRQAGKPQLHYAVTAMDRYGNESAPIYESWSAKAAYAQTSLLANNGKTLSVPQQPLDAKLLTISDMKGRVVYTCLNKPEINISRLKDGMYILRSKNKKNVTHRLGYFIIKR